MNAVLPALACLLVYALAYLLYARFLARRVPALFMLISTLWAVGLGLERFFHRGEKLLLLLGSTVLLLALWVVGEGLFVLSDRRREAALNGVIGPNPSAKGGSTGG